MRASSPGSGFAEVARDLVVVGDARNARAQVVGDLCSADALVARARIERDVEVRHVGEDPLGRHVAEQDDVVTVGQPPPETAARPPDQPQAGGDASADLLPELEQVLDVVQRVPPTPIAVEQQ